MSAYMSRLRSRVRPDCCCCCAETTGGGAGAIRNSSETPVSELLPVICKLGLIAVAKSVVSVFWCPVRLTVNWPLTISLTSAVHPAGMMLLKLSPTPFRHQTATARQPSTDGVIAVVGNVVTPLAWLNVDCWLTGLTGSCPVISSMPPELKAIGEG